MIACGDGAIYSYPAQSIVYQTFSQHIDSNVSRWFEVVPDEPKMMQYNFVIGGVEGSAVFHNTESNVKLFMEVIEEYDGMSIDLFIKSSGFIRIALMCHLLAIDGKIYKCRGHNETDIKNEMTRHAAQHYLEEIQ